MLNTIVLSLGVSTIITKDVNDVSIGRRSLLVCDCVMHVLHSDYVTGVTMYGCTPACTLRVCVSNCEARTRQY